MSRAVCNSFVWLAVNNDHPEWGPAVKGHYFPDCVRITANNCHAERVGANRDSERPICYTCVSRLVALVEAGA